ncbi:MAG: hypothetical protein Greene041679_575 [Parcubacteria group bacterium Greene0416_79]|nr:MAG: hypothetical protein Greene041679_575 [Parcubacteria group bacterium Greene0416_79]
MFVDTRSKPIDAFLSIEGRVSLSAEARMNVLQLYADILETNQPQVIVYGDKVAIKTFKEGISTAAIESKHIAGTFRLMFEYM